MSAGTHRAGNARATINEKTTKHTRACAPRVNAPASGIAAALDTGRKKGAACPGRIRRRSRLVLEFGGPARRIDWCLGPVYGRAPGGRIVYCALGSGLPGLAHATVPVTEALRVCHELEWPGRLERA